MLPRRILTSLDADVDVVEEKGQEELICNPVGAHNRQRILRTGNEWHSSQPALVSGNVISDNVGPH